jgi:hypothetical protein
MTLKGRWHKKINLSIQKFVGCYKQAIAIEKIEGRQSILRGLL